MKLRDLLVQELPRRGGWPEGAVECQRFVDESTIDFYDEDGNWPQDCGKVYGPIAHQLVRKQNQPCELEIVTRDQYEAALAAAQQPVWNGEGLPPIGCEFEFGTHRTRAKCLGIGHHMIFASKGDPDDEDGDFEEFMISIVHSEFHPIHSEAELKRKAAIDAIAELCRSSASNGHSAEMIYAAIEAGNIPGVKLEAGDAN